MQHQALASTGRYIATITIDGEKFISYPSDFDDVLSAYEEAARQACHQLLIRNSLKK